MFCPFVLLFIMLGASFDVFSICRCRGEQIANEFQMILPENIQDHPTFSASPSGRPAYAIDDVSPLVINNDEVVTISFSTSEATTTGDWIGAYSPASVIFEE
jgi:hypothetical protein